ncbi:MAG: hypothetical protein GY716_15955 [bacterium]|nr:hypothetical protein [bacterium]
MNPLNLDPDRLDAALRSPGRYSGRTTAQLVAVLQCVDVGLRQYVFACATHRHATWAKRQARHVADSLGLNRATTADGILVWRDDARDAMKIIICTTDRLEYVLEGRDGVGCSVDHAAINEID